MVPLAPSMTLMRWPRHLAPAAPASPTNGKPLGDGWPLLADCVAIDFAGAGGDEGIVSMPSSRGARELQFFFI